MIQSILIKNYALIEKLEVNFIDGFTVLSGETGSGKSIILDAIALLMGKRSDRESLFNKKEKCILEINLKCNKIKKNIFEINNIDFDENTIVRREISTTGKSRSFINDTPVTLVILNEIVSSILEIYSQNQSINLKFEDKQLRLIDKISNSTLLLKEYQSRLFEYNIIKKEIENIRNRNNLSEIEIEFLNFQIDELEKSNLEIGEKEKLEQKYLELENSTTITKLLSKSYNYLSEQDGINIKISEIESELNKVSNISENLSSLHKRISSIRIELQDLEYDLNTLGENVNSEPNDIKKVSDRLDLINSLMMKHRKKNLEELINLLCEMKLKRNLSIGFEDLIMKKNNLLTLKESELKKCAKKLTVKRKSVCSNFSKNVVNHLYKLGIKSPVFKVQFYEEQNYSLNGIDSIQFLFSANKGSEPLEISKVASGGELSRIMLCFSYLVSDSDDLSCIIFDEIDTGVSGEIADLMSEMMNEMSTSKQIISVTHLPQIASKATTHYKVYKTEQNNRTVSEIKQLSFEERIEEIAKMLSGKNITKTSISNAKELLSQ